MLGRGAPFASGEECALEEEDEGGESSISISSGSKAATPPVMESERERLWFETAPRAPARALSLLRVGVDGELGGKG